MQRRGLALPCYEGDKPFIYACFGSADARRVQPFLQQLLERRFRLHYSGDKNPDGERAERMAMRIRDASVMLLFFSERANDTPIWRYQVNYAMDCKKKILCVRLDDSEPSKGMRLQFAGLDFFDAFRERDMDAFFPAFTKMEGVTQALIGDGVEGYPRGAKRVGLLQRVWFYVACTALLAAIALAILLPPRIRAMRATMDAEAPEIVYLAEIQFSEPLIQSAVVETLGKESTDTVFEDDLRTITKLAICGGVVLKDTDIVQYTVAANTQRASVNGYQVAEGNIRDIRELALLSGLSELMLSEQQITDISALSELQGLTSLDVSGNPITDLTPLTKLPLLTALDISCTQATDFSALSSLPSLTELRIRNLPDALDVAEKLPLKTLCVSGTALSGALERIAGMTTLTTLDISNTDVSSIEPLTRLPNLKVLYLEDCHAVTDWDALMRMPALMRVYVSVPTALALPEETFRALVDRGVEIAL